MTKSKITPRETRPGTGDGRLGLLPVSKAVLRWSLGLRLLLAVPVGVFLGGFIAGAFGLESDAEAATAGYCGLALSFALFLFVTWRLGVSRRAAFAAAGGDPDAAGVLLFGVMKPRTRSCGSGSGGYSGDGGSSGDCGGGDGGGGGGD